MDLPTKELEPGDVNLHYAQLDYLFENRLLSSSVFNHCWEDFVRKHEEFRNFLLGDLKLIFWSLVVPNIGDYQLLSDEMLEYFETGFMEAGESTFMDQTLKNNEPVAGRDYKVFEASHTTLNVHTIEEEDEADETTIQERMRTTVVNAFQTPQTYKNSFWDADSDTDDHCLLIQKSRAPNDDVEDADDLVKTFSAILRTEEDDSSGIKMLSLEDMLERFKDPDYMTDIDQMKTLPAGFQLFLSRKFPIFNSLAEASSGNVEIPSGNESDINPPSLTASRGSSDKENVSRVSMNIPAMSPDSEAENSFAVRAIKTRSSSSSYTPGSIQAARLSALNKSQKSSPATPLRGNQQTTAAARNPRMEKFVTGFARSKVKRRRSSSSPPPQTHS